MVTKMKANGVVVAVLNFGLILLFAFPALPLNISGMTVLGANIIALFSFMISKHRVKLPKINTWVFVLLSTIFLIYLSELVYASDKPFVWSIVQRKMGLMAVPIAFFLPIPLAIHSKPTGFIGSIPLPFRAK